MIRRANAEDVEALTDLVRQLGYEKGSAHQINVIAKRNDQVVFVAVESERVAGFIHVAEVLSLESEIFGEIRALVVDDAHRGRGIGEELVRAAEEWTRARNIDRVRVRSNIKRARTRRFYERLGYSVTKTQNVFDKTLDS